MSGVFHRPDLAREVARQLINPGVKDEGLRTGLFLSGLPRIGKTTFFINDLIPALEQAGASVIYVDLRSNTQTSPASLVLSGIKRTLTELIATGSNILTGLKRNTDADIGVAGCKFGFKLDTIGQEGGPTLAQALSQVIDQVKMHVVLIVDEAQRAISSEAPAAVPARLPHSPPALN